MAKVTYTFTERVLLSKLRRLKRPYSHLWKLAKGRPTGASEIRANKFKCLNCKDAWKHEDMSVDYDLSKVSCSSCYSDKIVITELKLLWY